MQNPKRRSAPVLKTYPLKEYPFIEYTPQYAQKHVRNGHKPVQAILCAALLLPGLLSLPAFVSAQEAAQEAAQEPVQETVQEEAKQAVPGPAQSRTAPETKTMPDPAGTAKTSESAKSAESNGSASSDSSAGSDTSAAGGLHLPSLTDFAPGSVCSGTLGELVRLQAGQEMARAALSLKEIQARILEVENSMAKARRELSEAKAREEADRAQNGPGGASLQEALNELKAGFASLAEDVAALRLEKAQGNDRQCLVLSVRSQGSRLVAELATREGRFLAGAGDRVPGVGRIDTVSRSKVTAEGRSLPWK